MQRQYVHVDARTISYFDSAPGVREARVVVLVHAFPLGAAMWEGQARALPEGWRLLAPDLRGFGGSTLPEPDDSQAIADYATDVLDLLRELGIAEAVIGGCSMGGYVAMAMLRLAPQIATGVILVDTRATADSLEARGNRRSMLALVEREGPSGVARDMMPRLLGRTTLEERADVEPIVRRLIKQQSPAAIRGAITRMMHRPETFDVLARVQVPMLVVVGGEDVLTPEADARRIAEASPNAELVVIPQAGHLPNLERPDVFNDAVRAFLGRL